MALHMELKHELEPTSCKFNDLGNIDFESCYIEQVDRPKEKTHSEERSYEKTPSSRSYQVNKSDCLCTEPNLATVTEN